MIRCALNVVLSILLFTEISFGRGITSGDSSAEHRGVYEDTDRDRDYLATRSSTIG